MGNVDTVQKVVKNRKAVWGPDSGHGSLIWFNMFDYTFYNGLRTYQHAMIEKKLDQITTFKEFKKARQKVTFTKFLYQLTNRDIFGDVTMNAVFPGLRELIDRSIQPGNVGIVQAVPTDGVAQAVPISATLDLSTGVFVKPYQRMKPFLTPGHAWYRTRLDTSIEHPWVRIPVDPKSDKKDNRGRCIVCCEHCEKGNCNATVARQDGKGTRTYGRSGRKSAKYCITCNVVLCKHCYKQFHTSNVPLSPCSDHHPLLHNRSTRSSAVTPSPSAKQLQILSRCSRRPVESSPPPTNRQASNAPSTPTRIGKNYKKQGHSVPPNTANVLPSPRRRAKKRSEDTNTTQCQPSPLRTHRKKKGRNINAARPLPTRQTRSMSFNSNK